jgi:hypothetical protein
MPAAFHRDTAPWLAALALTLAAAATPALAGTVAVRFVEPTRYSDVRDARLSTAEVQKPLEEALVALGSQLPGNQRLEIDITDVDLAGEIEPIGPRMDMVRVMRSHTWPRIAMHYTLRDAGGQALRSAELTVSDMDYLNNSRPMGSSDPLRYEKQMLSDWFRREFANQNAAQ